MRTNRQAQAQAFFSCTQPCAASRPSGQRSGTRSSNRFRNSAALNPTLNVREKLSIRVGVTLDAECSTPWSPCRRDAGQGPEECLTPRDMECEKVEKSENEHRMDGDSMTITNLADDPKGLEVRLAAVEAKLDKLARLAVRQAAPPRTTIRRRKWLRFSARRSSLFANGAGYAASMPRRGKADAAEPKNGSSRTRN